LFIAEQLGFEDRNSNLKNPGLLMMIFNIYCDLKEKYKVPWRFRHYKNKKYWTYVYRFNNILLEIKRLNTNTHILKK